MESINVVKCSKTPGEPPRIRGLCTAFGVPCLPIISKHVERSEGMQCVAPQSCTHVHASLHFRPSQLCYNLHARVSSFGTFKTLELHMQAVRDALDVRRSRPTRSCRCMFKAVRAYLLSKRPIFRSVVTGVKPQSCCHKPGDLQFRESPRPHYLLQQPTRLCAHVHTVL